MCKIMFTCGVVYLCAFNCVVWWFPGAREGDPTTRPGAIPRGGNIGAPPQHKAGEEETDALDDDGCASG